MEARLFCKTGPLAGASFVIREEATIGKSPGNTIQLSPPVISGNHAKIYYDRQNGCYMLQDMGSSNGTRVDGVRVRDAERLGALNVITFADTYDFLFQSGVDVAKPVPPQARPAKEMKKAPPPEAKRPEPVQASPTRFEEAGGEVPSFPPIQPKAGGRPDTMRDEGIPTPEIPAMPPPAPPVVPPAAAPPPPRPATVMDDGAFEVPAIGSSAPEAASEPQSEQPAQPAPQLPSQEAPVVFALLIDNSDGSQRKVVLKEGANAIGRIDTNHIMIEEPSISRNHAVITVAGERASVHDLGSKNHTFVNSVRIEKETELQPGMALMFGIVKAVFVKE